MEITTITICNIKPKYKRALKQMALGEITHFEKLNRIQLLLDIAIEIMVDYYNPEAKPDDVINFIEKTTHLPKEVAEVKMIHQWSHKKLAYNLTVLKKIKGWD